MTVYVDDARIQATVGRYRDRWSHLTADTVEELHAFADRIGLRRTWFQTCKSTLCGGGRPANRDTCPHWHYDVTESKRAQALASGAEEMDMRRWSELITARREAQREAS